MFEERIELPAGLTIEHALPQGWREHWALPADLEDPLLAEENRDQHVHRLGNLTLITQPLNSSLSNAAWNPEDPEKPRKREELQARSVLLLNQRLVAHEQWNEDLIDDRGEELCARVLRTWPGPDAETWPQTEDPDVSGETQGEAP